MKKEKKLKKRKSRNTEENSPSHNHLHANVHTILLASLANLHTNFSSRTLLTKCLNNLHNQSLNPSKTLTLINNNLFLSLLPPLLRTTKSIPSIAKRTAEIIGAISLQSFECNEKIASDEEILKALLDALVSSNKNVSMAACNAVLDLSTTSLAREKLCELNAVVKLMSIFLQSAAMPTKHAFLCSNRKISANFSGRTIMENASLVLIIDATVTLINTCNVKQLSKIPEKLSEITLSYLKVLLVQVQNQSLERHIAKCSKERTDCLSIIKFDDLTESIFRLSIDSGHFTATCGAEQVKKGIFGPNPFDFEHFMFNFWEKSPFFLKKPIGSPNDHRDSLSSVLWSSNSGRIHDVLSSILRSLVSCPPLPSDEVDILNFLKEAKDGLGQPITYGQDIRVIKAVEGNDTDQGYPKSEVHFQQWAGSCRSGPDLISIGDVHKCEEAYEKGYTIALRGMEFRSDNIASVANGLAVLFGQPSVGANAYLTPPESQGLARHYDDHCVFVCQLLGQKQWSVYPQSTLHLPRLYEPRDSSLGSEGEVPDIKSEKFLLEEGDILYIPRGCLHEACTRADGGGSDKHDASTGFSLHLTLGIEVESPFEWEGFAHVALHSWNRNNKQPLGTVVSLFPRTIDLMSVHLLHVAIQQIGFVDPTFAKACMVVAFSSPSDAQAKYEDALCQSQRDIFRYMISKIDRDARFLEAFKSVEVAVREKKEDMFQRMRWIRHLYPENSMKEGFDWDNPLSEFHNMYLLFDEHREYAGNVFMQVKSKFCREVIFEDACKSFEILLEKYKRVRTQYMNGMLNLHSTGNT